MKAGRYYFRVVNDYSNEKKKIPRPYIIIFCNTRFVLTLIGISTTGTQYVPTHKSSNSKNYPKRISASPKTQVEILAKLSVSVRNTNYIKVIPTYNKNYYCFI